MNPESIKALSGPLASFLYEIKRARDREPGAKDEGEVFEAALSELKPWLHADEQYALAWLGLMMLDRRALCDVVDSLWASLTPMQPVPGYQDTTVEADAWAASVPLEAKRAYFWAIWSSLSEEQQTNAFRAITMKRNGRADASAA